MRKESLNIAVACLIGGVLGVLFAIEIAELYEFGRYFWFAGAFAGGAIAYLAYDPSAAASAMRRAWHELADVEHAKRFLRGTVAVGEVVLLIVVMLSGIVFTFGGGIIGHELNLWTDRIETVWLLAAIVSYYGSLGGALFYIATLKPKEEAGDGPSFISSRKAVRRVALFINPVVLPLLFAAGTLFLLWKIVVALAPYFWRARALLRCVWRAPKATWLLAVFTARFVRLVFIYIHSTARVVCFVDTALGVAVAYTLVAPTLQAMLAGGAFGLVFGVLDYELISVRLLKLVPARARK